MPGTGMFAEIEYAIGLAEGWVRTSDHTFEHSDPWHRLTVRPTWSVSRTLEELSESVRGGLEQEIADQWPTYSLFEFTSLEEVTSAGRISYELRYRVQEAAHYCVVSSIERVAVVDGWHGLTTGLRVTSWMCQADAIEHHASRQAVLDSIQLTPRSSSYYTQALLVRGVLIKAPAHVSPLALSAAGDVIDWMLGTARRDVTQCLREVGASLAIIPRGEFVTSLPEFAVLSGQSDFTGRTYDSFAIRGLGAVRGQPVSATSEESLVGVGPERDLNITVHEFAHAIQNLCFTPADDQEWEEFYVDAIRASRYPGAHAMHDVNEFFAVFSSAYLGVTDELGSGTTSAEMIRLEFPDIFDSLRQIFGSPRPIPGG